MVKNMLDNKKKQYAEVQLIVGQLDNIKKNFTKNISKDNSEICKILSLQLFGMSKMRDLAISIIDHDLDWVKEVSTINSNMKVFIEKNNMCNFSFMI